MQNNNTAYQLGILAAAFTAIAVYGWVEWPEARQQRLARQLYAICLNDYAREFGDLPRYVIDKTCWQIYYDSYQP